MSKAEGVGVYLCKQNISGLLSPFALFDLRSGAARRGGLSACRPASKAKFSLWTRVKTHSNAACDEQRALSSFMRH